MCYNFSMTKDITPVPVPTILTKKMKKKIDKLIVDNPNIEKHEIAKLMNIDPEVLKELYIKDRQEELLKQAELTAQELLGIDLMDKEVEKKYGKARLNLLKLKQNESQFLRETLGKNIGYSKRSELTGADGGEIRIASITFNPPMKNKPEK